ncbi:MAG: hypothetical protein AAFY10_14920, partial [Pseudomonadota bacterium]
DIIAIASPAKGPAEGIERPVIILVSGKIALALALELIERGSEFIGEVAQPARCPLLQPVGALSIAALKFPGGALLKAGDVFQAFAGCLVEAAKTTALAFLFTLAATFALFAERHALAEPVCAICQFPLAISKACAAALTILLPRLALALTQRQT